ncbi:hypothetical protein [Stenotrophomonas sp. 278]|uniref:hypothetical protein n=1 Tax=Stenotrophomonas sp. 278 TaxID=2479851 RepID=UPI000F68FBE6|nr:hypothetical protein [Stenotrophomonas sp. 278]
MSYPVDAFVRMSSGEAPNGTLMFLRDFWTLAAEIEVPAGPKKKSLMLTGNERGKFYDRLEGVNDIGIAIAPGVSFELRITDPTSRTADGTYPSPGAVAVTPDGRPQIWVCGPSSEHDRRGFYLNGGEVAGEEHEHRPFIYFKSYEVWLTRGGKTLSDKPLFVVGQPAA